MWRVRCGTNTYHEKIKQSIAQLKTQRLQTQAHVQSARGAATVILETLLAVIRRRARRG